MTTRRAFLGTLAGGLFAAPLTAEAQPAERIARISCLGIDLTADPANRDAFLQSLRALGYVEGRNLAIEERDAEGKPERFPTLAAELPALKVDVIVTFGALRPPWAPSRRRGSFPLSSTLWAIRVRAGSSPAWRGPARMSRGCPSQRRSWLGSSWSS